jgi:transposase
VTATTSPSSSRWSKPCRLSAARRGRPRRRPRELFADRGYDHDVYHRLLRTRNITPRIDRRGVAHASGLGRQRRVVERCFAWLHTFKRLRTRYEHRADFQPGLLSWPAR